jgi:hypothetical protein
VLGGGVAGCLTVQPLQRVLGGGVTGCLTVQSVLGGGVTGCLTVQPLQISHQSCEELFTFCSVAQLKHFITFGRD